MRSVTVAQAQAFDKLAQERFGIPSLILMENAGRSVAEEALKMLRGKNKAAIICGMGNNGGDGLVAARHLLNAGVDAKVYLLGESSKIKADPKINLSILVKMKQKIIKVGSLKDLSGINKSDLVIDAIFGIGLRSEVRSPYSEVISFINRSGKPVLAVDVPSGLDADTGKVLGAAIKARKTVTFIAPKRGFLRNYGPRHCGKVVVREIGIKA